MSAYYCDCGDGSGSVTFHEDGSFEMIPDDGSSIQRRFDPNGNEYDRFVLIGGHDEAHPLENWGID